MKPLKWSLAIPLLSLTMFIYCIYLLSGIPRENFEQVLLIYSSAFAGFLLFYYSIDHSPLTVKIRLAVVLVIGLFTRCFFIDTTPAFSQDFYRFIYDGLLWREGHSAYIGSPLQTSELLAHIPYRDELLQEMGSLSRKHNSNYPPLNQLFFYLATLGSATIAQTVLKIRLMMILADVGIFFIGLKLLRFLRQPSMQIALYFLNPLVILELTGNLHFEGVMLLFCLLGVLFWFKSQPNLSGRFVIAAILVKLLPLMLLPAFIRKGSLKKSLSFFITLTVSIGTLAVLFFILGQESTDGKGYIETIALWFGTFEFNASLYYLIRAVGYHVYDYNIIGTAAPVLSVISSLFILLIAFYSYWKKLPEYKLPMTLMYMLLVYLLFATTVHPWYLILPLGFSILTRYRFMLTWTCTIIFSYAAYTNPGFTENLWLVAAEYLILAIVVIVELLGYDLTLSSMHSLKASSTS